MSHAHEELLSRIVAMKETLHSEWGVEHDHFRAEFARELADDVVDIALARRRSEQRLRAHVMKWRKWRRVRLEGRTR